MSQEAQALSQLAERMRLTPDQTAYLPISVGEVAVKLKLSASDVVEICRHNPTLTTFLANSCKKKCKPNKTSGHYRSTPSHGSSERGAVHTA
jgi:hypothetical protein